MKKINFNQAQAFYELDEFGYDQDLVEAVRRCVRAQKKAADSHITDHFIPKTGALKDVSLQALEEILKSKKDINGIRSEREISNVIVFNDIRYKDGVFANEVAAARKKVDPIMRQKMKELFGEDRLEIQSSGFFLYPPEGYMGWHTNWQNPGWRLYVSYAEEPGKSFFRYRDPATDEIITSHDKEINFRLFKASKDHLFWHSVYSQTYRYSLGYKITKTPNFFGRLKGNLLKKFRLF